MKRILVLMLIAMVAGCGGDNGGQKGTPTPKDITIQLLDAQGNPMPDLSDQYSSLMVGVYDADTYEWIKGKDVDEEGKVKDYSFTYDEGVDYVVFAEGYDQSFSEEDFKEIRPDGVQFRKVRLDEPKNLTIQMNGKFWDEDEQEFKQPNVILTVKDADGELLKVTKVEFASKALYEAHKKDGSIRAVPRFRTDNSGMLRVWLEPDEYVIGLDVSSGYATDYTRIPLDGNYVIESFSDKLEKEIQFGDVTKLKNIQQGLIDAEEQERLGQEQKEEQERLEAEQERCNPNKDNAALVCCARDFYRVDGAFEGEPKRELFGHEFDIGRRAVSRDKSEWVVYVDDEIAGNTSDDMLYTQGLVMDIVGCGHPRAGEPWCCMKIQSVDPDQRAYSIGQERDGLKLKDSSTMQDSESDYDLDYAFSTGDMVYFKNRTVKDYRGEKAIGVVLDAISLGPNEYLMSEGDSETLGNYTATLFSVMEDSAEIEVEFNHTLEMSVVEDFSTINGLPISLERTFRNSAIIGLG